MKREMLLKIGWGVLCLVMLSMGVIYGYGTTLPKEQVFERTFTVNASPSLVYSIAVDAGSQSAWRQSVQKITMMSDGKSWIEHTSQGDIAFEITDENYPNSFKLKLKGEGFEGRWMGSFTAVSIEDKPSTEVAMVEHIIIESIFMRALANIMQFSEKIMLQYEQDLKTEVERTLTML